MRLSNAGGYPIINTEIVSLDSKGVLAETLQNVENCIARGAGNSIGDGALNDNLVLSTLSLNRILSFDTEKGILIAESGVTLAEISSNIIPNGWFLATTPGTNQITLGGAVAADVHGKNHHVVGSFDNHVLWIEILTATHGIVRCSPEQNPDLFYATCGGVGLTGIILSVAVQLIRIPGMWIKQTSLKTRNLAETLDACETYGSSPYTVAWIDPHARGSSLGRGCFMAGNFATSEDLPKTASTLQIIKFPHKTHKIPLYFPVQLLNLRIWTEAVNATYSLKNPQGLKTSLVSAESFFYPLEAINLHMIGGGHITYQFVLPYSSSREGFTKIFQKIVDSQLGSFISVLKLFGPQKKYPGNISFPMEGYNLGIDFKVSKNMFELFRELDAIVLDFGGRHYLAKDVCLSPQSIRRGYGTFLDEFLEIKRRWDPNNLFRSLQSMRLKLY